MSNQILQDKITTALLQTISVDFGCSLVTSVVLHWATSTDLEKALSCFEEPVARSQNRKQLLLPAFSWHEIHNFSRSKKIHMLVSWTIRLITEKGLVSIQRKYNWSVTPNVEKFLSWQSFEIEFGISASSSIGRQNIRNDLDSEIAGDNTFKSIPALAKELAQMKPEEAIRTMTAAIVGWAWLVDPDIVKASAIQDKHYRDDWTHKNLVNYIFMCIDLLADDLLAREFDNGFINKWRIT